MTPKKPPTTVKLSKPNPEWSRLFTEAAAEIKAILQNNCIEIYHIGSTAIPNIYAKPIIDILPVVKDINQIDSLNSQFEALGYICMGEYGMPGRRFFWRGESKRTHNVHIFQEGSAEILRHVAFRDYMISHPRYAKAYSQLKCSLAEVFSNDIQHYVEGKDSFIQMIDYKTGHVRAAQSVATDNITIEPFNNAWAKLAEAEIKAIKAIAVDAEFISLEHIGSTAVPELASKPIIDILITVPSLKDSHNWIEVLETLGYIFWQDNPDKSHLRFFKGMPPFGVKRTHHVHIMEEKDERAVRYINFRNILQRDAKVRCEYEACKISLAESNKEDREAYTELKGKFIEDVLNRMMEE